MSSYYSIFSAKKQRPVKPLTAEQKAKALENLRDARAILEDKNQWIKGQLKRSNKAKQQQNPEFPLYSYCAVGAVNKANHPGAPTIAKKVLSVAIRSLFSNRRSVKDTTDYSSAENIIIGFNDHSTTGHKDLLRAFDRAIELASSDEEIVPPRTL